ncbi:MAG: hypothetical protein M4D80_15900 [Myxococcota bacterium]|nr:hypothetical protein [Deltaproteobacteria bacterium]MDQ3336651.1 hypothetical protein [Myxococcota bacterium]
MYRILIAIMCVATAGGLGYSAFSERWLENQSPSRRAAFSLLSSTRCVGESPTTMTCESKSNTDLMAELVMQPKEDASMAFATAGQATLGLSLLSALGLLLCAGWLVGNKRTSGPNGPQHLALIALMLALIAATVFIKTKPGGPTGVGAGPGFWVFGVACVLGIFAAQLASKLIKPLDPDPSL